MNSAALTRIGLKIHGIHWKAKLAADLGVDASTLRRWLARGRVPKGRAAHIELLAAAVKTAECHLEI